MTNLIPCVNPSVCGVQSHKDWSNCKAMMIDQTKLDGATSSIGQVTSSSQTSQEEGSDVRAMAEDYIESSFEIRRRDDMVHHKDWDVYHVPTDDDPDFDGTDASYGTRRQIATLALKKLLDDFRDAREEHPGFPLDECLDIVEENGVPEDAVLSYEPEMGSDIEILGDGLQGKMKRFGRSGEKSGIKPSDAYHTCYIEARRGLLEEYRDDLVDDEGDSRISPYLESHSRYTDTVQSYFDQIYVNGKARGTTFDEAKLAELNRSIDELKVKVRDEIRAYNEDPLYKLKSD